MRMYERQLHGISAFALQIDLPIQSDTRGSREEPAYFTLDLIRVAELWKSLLDPTRMAYFWHAFKVIVQCPVS